MSAPLEWIDLVDNTGRGTSLGIHGQRQEKDQTFALLVTGGLNHGLLIEPRNVEACDKWIAWLQEWKRKTEEKT